ncbi:MAG: YggS family pyridoxal phosphate-dependent enzyme [Bacteroidota bacterium]|nr:YggS family pyridoxal phosphate-dependent enzyme [Bacteroidota bacterium]
MSVTENLNDTLKSLPKGITLVAVSKFHPNESILEAYKAGQRVFGESRVQELIEKQKTLPSDIQWHFIGHLQTNKVKQIIPFVALIHSIDSVRLLSEIDKEAKRIGRVIPCLLQIHVAQEETKFGFSPEECLNLFASGTYIDFRNVKLKGLMGMASLTENASQIRSEFNCLKQCFDQVKQTYFPSDASFRELSMGMSNDYPIAIEEGSTMVRIGSLIFGERVY